MAFEPDEMAKVFCTWGPPFWASEAAMLVTLPSGPNRLSPQSPAPVYGSMRLRAPLKLMTLMEYVQTFVPVVIELLMSPPPVPPQRLPLSLMVSRWKSNFWLVAVEKKSDELL